MAKGPGWEKLAGKQATESRAAEQGHIFFCFGFGARRAVREQPSRSDPDAVRKLACLSSSPNQPCQPSWFCCCFDGATTEQRSCLLAKLLACCLADC
jgi:hypothetical protein